MDSLIAADRVVVGYNRRGLTKPISFAIGAGEVLWISGPNGIGKTTLLRTLALQLVPVSGDVSISDGAPPTLVTDADGLFETESLASALKVLRPWSGATSNLVGRLVNECRMRTDLLPQALNGGERRLSRLAYGLQVVKRVLLLDEPFDQLDDRNQRAVERIIRECSHLGAAVVVVSHVAPLELEPTSALMVKPVHESGAGGVVKYL